MTDTNKQTWIGRAIGFSIGFGITLLLLFFFSKIEIRNTQTQTQTTTTTVWNANNNQNVNVMVGNLYRADSALVYVWVPVQSLAQLDRLQSTQSAFEKLFCRFLTLSNQTYYGVPVVTNGRSIQKVSYTNASTQQQTNYVETPSLWGILKGLF